MNPKKTKASVLVFALIILFIGISAAIGIAGSTVISQKNSINTASSTQSFQVADSGAEIFLNKIYNPGSAATLSALFTCVDNAGVGEISGNIGTPDKKYKITAQDANGADLACNATLSKVERIKSVGSYKSTNRSVSVAVAATGTGTLSCTVVTSLVGGNANCPAGYSLTGCSGGYPTPSGDNCLNPDAPYSGNSAAICCKINP